MCKTLDFFILDAMRASETCRRRRSRFGLRQSRAADGTAIRLCRLAAAERNPNAVARDAECAYAPTAAPGRAHSPSRADARPASGAVLRNPSLRFQPNVVHLRGCLINGNKRESQSTNPFPLYGITEGRF